MITNATNRIMASLIMSQTTVVLITGVGRGIGKALMELYLSRANYTVIGSVRDASLSKYDELRKLKASSGSRLLLVSLEGTSHTDPKAVVETIRKAGISHIDIAIANAGICPEPVYADRTPVQDLLDAFNVNAVAPLLLYQSIRPLLLNAARPVYMVVSSVAGAISTLESEGLAAAVAYGSSKAATNFITTAMHAYDKDLIAFTIHPGFIATDMGMIGAKAFNLTPPDTLEDSVTKIAALVDGATREKTSGKFWDVITGEQMTW